MCVSDYRGLWLQSARGGRCLHLLITSMIVKENDQVVIKKDTHLRVVQARPDRLGRTMNVMDR